MVSQAFDWWSRGLAAALINAEKAVHRPRRFRLHAQARPFELHPMDGSTSRPVASIKLPDDLGAGALPEHVLQQTSGSVIEVVVPSAAILERRLDPLPGESRPYVDNVVRHQIENIFPWRGADVLHATLIRDQKDGRIDVTVRATPRSAVEPALAAAVACGAGEVILVGDETDARGPDMFAIPVSAGRESLEKIDRAHTVARYAIAALGVFTACLIGWTTFVHWSMSDEIAALDRSISDRRAVLQRASGARGDARDDGLEGRKQRTPVAVVVMDALSTLLPDDTYLTDMSLDAGRLRITGVSARATELVPLLEGSGHFKNASFYAPTTRMPGRSTDRFSIEAVVVPQTRVAP